jgi:decaprenylphospho-beta-D-ribofuranose 2-oxidase
LKRKIDSWGKLFPKEVIEVNNLDINLNSYLKIGNSNSYGDVAIPKEDAVLDLEELHKGDFISSNITISQFINSSNQILYGIPGKSNVTLGGAVASDTHGKDNLWGGSFIKNIKEIKILLASGDELIVSRASNPEIFYSTVGGYGLTGVILGVNLFKNNIPISNKFSTKVFVGREIGNLVNNFELSSNAYWVGWINLLSKDYDWVVEISEPIDNSDIISKKIDEVGEFNFSLPFIGKNYLKSLELINKIYYILNSKKLSNIKNLKDVIYPLTKFSDTRNISHRRKIIQIQFSIPLKNESALSMLLDAATYRQSPLLCSIKRLNKNETNLNLSYVQDGWTIAIDYPHEKFDHTAIRKFYKLLIDHGGLIYLAKDSTLLDFEFKKMFPNFNNWHKIVKEIDKNKKFQSMLSERLKLKNW